MQHRWRFEGVFVWFPDQVRDDGLQESHLKEDVFIDSLFILHFSFLIFNLFSPLPNPNHLAVNGGKIEQ